MRTLKTEITTTLTIDATEVGLDVDIAKSFLAFTAVKAPELDEMNVCWEFDLNTSQAVVCDSEGFGCYEDGQFASELLIHDIDNLSENKLVEIAENLATKYYSQTPLSVAQLIDLYNAYKGLRLEATQQLYVEIEGAREYYNQIEEEELINT